MGLWTNRNPLRSPLSTFYADGWHLGGTDALLAGENVELSPRLTLCRRPGNNQFSTAKIPSAPLTFYSFKYFGSTIYLIVDTGTNVYTLTNSTLTSIFTKGTGAGQANFLGIGGTLYLGDGVETKAWQNSAIRNWGITITGFSTAVGPNTATNGYDAGGDHPWANPSAVTSNVSYATVSISVLGNDTLSSDALVANTFGFGISLGTPISGIGVTFTGFDGGPLTGAASFGVVLFYGGWPIGEIKYVAASGSPTTINLGGAGDTWSAGLSGANVNDPSFGVGIFAQLHHAGVGSLTNTFSAQNVQITIYGTFGPAVTLTTGTLTATTGYQYVAAYGNSASGQVSSATPPSNLVKPSTQGVQISLVASTDPQVNQIWVFRTADGGSTYFNLPSSPYPNITQNVVDNAPDSILNILEQAPVNHANDPPPATALDPVFYLGIVWIHTGNAVYFSRTPSAIVGITPESFPPANVFTFPETVIRKVPINSGLLVFTTSNIYIIVGQNTSTSVLYSAPFLQGYGIESWNALWVDGSIIYFFTSDNRLIRLDPSSGVEDMGFPIGDVLALLVPSRVYVTYHSFTSNDSALYIGDGSTGWYRCNPNQAPDGQITGPVWSPQAIIAAGCQALVSAETAPGTHQLLIGSPLPNAAVLTRDSRYLTFTDNGATYEANYTIGNVVLAQPGEAAICRFITYDAVKIGNKPQISVNMDEILEVNMHSISGYMVNDPPYLAAPSTLWSQRCYFKQTVGGAVPPPVVCRFMSIEVDYGTDTVQNEILSLTINGAIFHER